MVQSWASNLLIVVLMQLTIILIYYYWNTSGSQRGRIVRLDAENYEVNKTILRLNSEKVPSYSESMKRVHLAMRDSIFLYNRTLNLPLLRLTPAERNISFRIDEARKWLKTQHLVIASSVRNAMGGLPSSVAIMMELSKLFKEVTAVFVENDSDDNTRSYLYDLTKQNIALNFKAFLLGCGNINSPDMCKINIRYESSGKQHKPGHNGQRVNRDHTEDSIDRGLVMAALRNMYLQFIYDNVQADLLLVLESDLRWQKWDMNSVLQGLFYFKSKQKLDSLCAFTIWKGWLHDACTLVFFHNKYFYVDAKETESPFMGRAASLNKFYEKHLNIPHSKPEHVPTQPVKVGTCFQGAAFYRVSSLRAASAFYKYSEGEWHCEHSTLSKQLDENYLDTQMQLHMIDQITG